ncbi:inhibitor of nuclear factor kappa-B kinase-interacting protein-like isoform X2 [Synchiropus splendidus]|uniref:inhibitor of nuclear factor kappa-B kinase-interacting protein-like isoform X2 n=1 Tax=Synchiropus splendidus TaxID=270530 RepID=UPI00237D916F|nr:inhibitor of nuclear factor kappa-B kinase-interacting protein-like isoform X2 [Synchiropus splendidus]
MPSDVKQRKKTPQQGELKKSSEEPSAEGEKSQVQKVSIETGNVDKTWLGDLKTFLCLASLAACAALSWMVLQQNERFGRIEEQHAALLGKTSALFAMEEQVLLLSRKCGSLQLALTGLPKEPDSLEGLDQDVARLKDWASELAERRSLLEGSLTTLTDAVDQIQGRTTAITKDFSNKVASVRTDVRRMDGLQSELDPLLSHVGELEGKAAQVERSMVKRIGDLLVSSVERVSGLRAASERNTQAVERLRLRVPELQAAERKISDRLRELEGSRARVIRTVTFASDLKPKLATMKRDFAAFDPQLADLTLRIGRLAEDLTQREREITELRRSLSNLTAAERQLGLGTLELPDSPQPT